MAFTIEEVNAALSTHIINGVNLSMPEKFAAQHPEIYDINNIITLYLTGEISNLQGLPQSPLGYYFFGSILGLLKDIENPSVNDQLIINIIHAPAVGSDLRHLFLEWLTKFTINSGSENAFKAALNQFRLLGYKKDEDIFMHLVFTHNNYYQHDGGTLDIKNIYLKQFLLQFIKTQHKLFTPAFTTYTYNRDSYWSYVYFTLLEEANSQFAAEYALYSVYMERISPVVFFSTYKNGHYMPAIVQFITDANGNNLDIIQSKFRSAMLLANADVDKFLPLALDLSRKYLDYYSINMPREKYEAYFGFGIDEFKGTELNHIPYSTCAFHLLLKYRREEALALIREFFNKKVYIHGQTIMLLQYHLTQESLPYLTLALQSDTSVGGIEFCSIAIALLQKHFTPAQYVPLVWGLSSSKTKAIRELAASILSEKDVDAENNAIALLENKNAETRQTAALVLGKFSSPTATAAIKKVLDKEANDNARDILLQAVASTLPAEASYQFITDMVAAAKSRGKLNKPIEAWLTEDALTPLYFTNGAQLDTDTTRFLLYRMARTKTMRSDIEAKYIIQLLDKEKAAPFAITLIKLFGDKGAKPEHKYLMALAALLGNDVVADKIRITINRWIEENRYKMAEYGVGALAIQGSNKALRWVEWYSRKYKSKKANVGAAALLALEDAAEELGITTQELGDRIVPDFGFDGLFKHFTIDGGEYRAFIDSNFKIAFFDEDNKKLKALPAAASTATKDEFKAIAKEVKDITKSQSSRLEYYLVIQRKWAYTQWQQFFQQNPVMFIYATKLLWGIYSNGGKLVQTFTCKEDTSLVNVCGDEIDIAADALVGIVHPSQLDAKSLQQWRQQFFDLSIEPIFPQLDRKMPVLTDIDLTKTIITKFEGKKMKTGYIRSTLERLGWHKGPTGDGGMLESFNLLYFEKKLEAVLEIEGVGAGYGWGGDEKLGRLYVVDKTKVPLRGSYYPRNDSDDKLLTLKDVPEIFLNEMLAAIEAIKPAE